MLFVPIEIELDKPRKYLLRMKRIMQAETEINKRRTAEGQPAKPIDYLIHEAGTKFVTDGGNFFMPMDLFIVVLWAGLLEDDASLSVDKVSDIVDASPLSRGQLTTLVWSHYLDVTSRKSHAPNGVDRDEESADPLARRPGSTSGHLQ